MLILVLLFIVVPIAELYVIIQVGQWIGIWPTLALLLADALLGSFLLRHQGRSAWRRFNQALDQGRFPAKEVADGVLITVGGTLLLAPGFLTDIVGLVLLIPPSRALVRGLLKRLGMGRVRVVAGPAQWGYERMQGRRGPGPEQGPGGGYRPPGGPSRSYDVEGEAREVTSEPRDLPPADSPEDGAR